MTKQELETLAQAWPSKPAMADDLGVSRATVYHWFGGVRSVPEPAARLMRLLHDHPEMREKVKNG